MFKIDEVLKILRYKAFYSLILFWTGVMLFSSCAPTKKAAYFRVSKELENLDIPDETYNIPREGQYVIKSGDELYITVTTSDNEPNNFNSNTTGFSDIDLLSYLVDNEGFVKLPYTGKMKMAGLTFDAAADSLEGELSQYLYQPVVSIKIVNAKITVLGEVGSPGIFMLNNSTINIYQALGYAGDISVFGNRKKVLIVREENNIVKKKYVDLTNNKLIESSWYTVMPNDIIYVEPLMGRSWGIETFPWDLVTSAVSTTILIMTFMITLIN